MRSILLVFCSFAVVAPAMAAEPAARIPQAGDLPRRGALQPVTPDAELVVPPDGSVRRQPDAFALIRRCQGGDAEACAALSNDARTDPSGLSPGQGVSSPTGSVTAPPTQFATPDTPSTPEGASGPIVIAPQSQTPVTVTPSR